MNRRGNYRNIGNNFVQGETYQQQPMMHQQQQQQRQTRSANPTPVPQSANIPIKTESSPQQHQPAAAQQQVQPVVTTSAPIKVDESIKNMSISEEDMLKLKKINFKKKVSGKEKRTRLNKKLLKMLSPRNAIAAMNELYSTSINDVNVVPVQGNKFEAELVINNVKFIGVGNSKMSAKNSACEKALRDLVINKFQNVKAQDLSEDVNMDEPDASDVPMLQLASFALHKLFAEWEAEGFQIPLPKINPEQQASAANSLENPTTAKVAPKVPKVRSELPQNSENMHPVMLLSVMRPCVQYNDLGSQGITPNIKHTVGCTVDGQSFIGEGRSKKEARKRVATQILIKLFNWQGSCC
ncbi:hypothetical protein PVAND_011688 [Polypedilum vanderplanki]|uniref:DRBM domain-containing protein n=1 Tax=Polypedilum vanderplanki TaxID=319348 RepID=A0A9J6CJD8_POLVA|nr:hypothetical protein PVAND_011688 [Polypedilum vanderplanki]